MNASTIIGIVGAVALIVIGAWRKTDAASLLWDPTALVIVLGGTLAATFVAFPLKEVLRVFRVFWIVLRNEKLYAQHDVEELTRITKALRDASVADVEKTTRNVANPFLRLGLQLVLDNASQAEISSILNYRIEKLKTKEQAEANIFRAMASFAPALGMVGTLLGLVNMLAGIGGDIIAVGANLAVALMSTLYGVVAANVLFKPIALKLEHRTQQRVELMNLVLEGVLLVQQRRSPLMVSETMRAFTVEHGTDELGAGRRPKAREPKRPAGETA